MTANINSASPWRAGLIPYFPSGCADVGKAVQASASPESPYYSQGSKPGGSPLAAPPAAFFVPPPIAIAHHLLRQWAAHDGPWFGPEAPPPQQQQYQGEQQVEQPEPATVSNL
jgi:NAD+ diphosphatase